jgi:hypothetical protein
MGGAVRLLPPYAFIACFYVYSQREVSRYLALCDVLKLHTAGLISKPTAKFYPHRTELSKSTGKVVPVFSEAPRRVVYGGTEV